MTPARPKSSGYSSESIRSLSSLRLLLGQTAGLAAASTRFFSACFSASDSAVGLDTKLRRRIVDDGFALLARREHAEAAIAPAAPRPATRSTAIAAAPAQNVSFLRLVMVRIRSLGTKRALRRT